MSNQKTTDGKKRASGLMKLKHDIRYGRGVSLRFFRQNVWLLVVFIVIVLVLIGLRYRTKTRMMEIKQLNFQLEQAQNRKMAEQAAYMSLIRESEMKRLVGERKLDLEFQEYPPYEVHADEK